MGLCHHVSPVHGRAAIKITKAPGTTGSNTNSKNSETLVIFKRCHLFAQSTWGLLRVAAAGRALNSTGQKLRGS